MPAPEPVKIEIDALTSGIVGGSGVFDKLMVSLVAHLKVEYEAARISGAEYTKAYTAIVSAALGAASQFILGSDQTYWGALTAEAQVNNLEKQGAGLDITNNTILPAQENLLKEQMEAQRAQTLNTRSDGVTTVVGLIGKQKDLYSEQITSYTRDAKTKAAKIFSDAWITQKTMDEGLLAPAQFANAEIDEVLTALRTAVDLD